MFYIYPLKCQDMKRKHNKNKADLYHYLLLIILTTALGIGSGWDFQFSSKNKSITIDLKTFTKHFPKANNFLQEDENIYKILSGSDTLGYGILATNNLGYGGPVPLLIALQKDTIKNIQLLANNETDEFLEYIKEDRLVEQWEGKNINLVSTMKVNAVSGATETSHAIIRGVKQGSARYLNEEQSHLNRDFFSIAKDVVFLLVILISLMMSYIKSLKKYRWIYLIIILLVLGIYLGKVLSLKLLYGWLSKGIAWKTNWQSTILLILAVAMPLIKRPKFYCNYLCPMGAFQELINKISPTKKRRLHLKNSPISLNEIYLALILTSLILGFSIDTSYLEPFMVFAFNIAGTALFIFVGIIAIMSFFFNRPWCAICPTGCLINKVHNK